MGRKVVVLGAGMIGATMARDLRERGYDVTVADVREDALARVAERAGARTLRADLADPAEVTRVALAHELVVGALPSAIGLQSLRAVIEAGRDMVDISFIPEDPLVLDARARERGVTMVVDCGVSPGVSNAMVGRAAAHFDHLERAEIFVGGLPVARRWPFDYKAGFAPHDVIEEYTRPARLVEHGRVVVREALSEPELMDMPGIGTLEAFNTDGLRTLLHTVKAPFMKEKTLRYPGHIALMRALRDTGFFGKDLVSVRGQMVRPLDVTAAVMFPHWKFEEGEADLTVLRVSAEGTVGGVRQRLTWDLVDSYAESTGERSMSRTTAFPATAVLDMVAKGEFRRPGLCAPEVLGADARLLDRLLAELTARGVKTRSHQEVLETEPELAAV